MHAATWSGETSRSRSPRVSHHARDCPTVRRYAVHVLTFAIRRREESQEPLYAAPRRPSLADDSLSSPFVTTSDSAAPRALVIIPSSPLPRRERLEPLAVVQEGGQPLGVAPGPSERRQRLRGTVPVRSRGEAAGNFDARAPPRRRRRPAAASSARGVSDSRRPAEREAARKPAKRDVSPASPRPPMRSASGAEGHRFESCRARQLFRPFSSRKRAFFLGFSRFSASDHSTTFGSDRVSPGPRTPVSSTKS